jgi:membrane protein HdeD
MKIGWHLRPCWLLAIYAVCLLGAGLNHAHDLWQGGWLPYRMAPLLLNWYWTSLTLLDSLAVVFLLVKPRIGSLLTLAIIVSDVAVNSYAIYALGNSGWYSLASLQLQTLFLGFVLGSFPFLWRNYAQD